MPPETGSSAFGTGCGFEDIEGPVDGVRTWVQIVDEVNGEYWRKKGLRSGWRKVSYSER